MPATYVESIRNKLRAITGTSKISDIDEWAKALTEDVDTKMASFWNDTFAKRPAAAQSNRIFRASDTGTVYLDNGIEWIPLALYAEDTAAKRPAAGRVGRIFRASDTGAVALDNGNLWIPVLVSGGAYAAKVELPANTEREISSTRAAFVMYVTGSTATTVQGVTHTALTAGANMVSFYLPAGAKFKCTGAVEYSAVLL